MTGQLKSFIATTQKKNLAFFFLLQNVQKSDERLPPPLILRLLFAKFVSPDYGVSAIDIEPTPKIDDTFFLSVFNLCDSNCECVYFLHKPIINELKVEKILYARFYVDSQKMEEKHCIYVIRYSYKSNFDLEWFMRRVSLSKRGHQFITTYF